MGLYTVQCSKCNKLYQWFSGNIETANICTDCQKGNETMSNDSDLVNAFKETIKTQADLISYLKTELERLKASQINPYPLGVPSQPIPGTTHYSPLNPLPIPQPQWPYITYRPHYIIHGDTGTEGVSSIATSPTTLKFTSGGSQVDSSSLCTPTTTVIGASNIGTLFNATIGDHIEPDVVDKYGLL